MFRADATRYCMVGEIVERIVWLPALSSLDGVPAWFVGVLNLKGERIVVIDFSVWMGHVARAFSVKQKLLILNNGQARLAIVVDDVDGLEEWSGEIFPLIQHNETPLLLGEVRRGDDIVMLVDHDALFAASQNWPLQAIRSAQLFQAVAIEDVALFQTRMHQLAKEVVVFDADALLEFAIVSTGTRRYAVALDQIMEFCRSKKFTYLPDCPEAMVGCMNLRGEIIAILDLDVLLELDPSPHDAQVLVLTHDEKKFSFVIESIERLVVAVDSNVIEIPDQEAPHPLSDALLRNMGEVIPILNFDAVLSLFKSQQEAYANL